MTQTLFYGMYPIYILPGGRLNGVVDLQNHIFRTGMAEENPLILQVRDAYKTYDGAKLVLKGLNMSVKRGTVYGLLGSSGCGKSTLLNSIVGLMQLDAGEIILPKNITKRNVGFMPQELSLQKMMKTEEVFWYFGTMYGMAKSEIAKRMNFLYDLLQLPRRDQLLHHLSGGQIRRVSLAATLIHDPSLLILDEPTVGVDPVLRQSIWDHLLKLCNDNKVTIIITTHYIEETRQANTVGFLRDGILLCEEPPDSIITRLGCFNLEEAYLVLSKQQSIASANSTDDTPKFNKLSKINSPLSKTNMYFSYPRYLAELKKNFFALWRNIPLLLYLFGLPIASVLLFNFGTGHEPKNLMFGVVNNDIPSSRHCNLYLAEGSKETCSLKDLSCRYLEKLNQTTDMKLILYDTLEGGLLAVQRNKVWGLAHFPENYTINLGVRIQDGRFADDDSIDNSVVDIYMDRSNRVMDEIIQRNIRQAFRDFIGDLFIECDWIPRSAAIPIKFEDPVYGDSVPTFRDYAAPAMVVLILFSMPLVYGVVIIIEEKNSGATGRSIAAGVNLLEVLVAHSVIQVGIQFIQTFSTMFMIYYVFQYKFLCPLLSTILLLLQGCAGVSLAFVIAIACDSLPGATCMCTAWVISSILLGGMIWPQQGIHPFLKPISIIMPITHPIESLRGLTQRGWGLSYSTVWLGFLSCILWTIFFIGVCVIVVKKTKAKAFLSKKIL